MMRKTLSASVLFLALFFLPAGMARANPALILRGVVRTLGAVFEVPRCMIEDSGQIMFPVGVATGAVRGAMSTVMKVLGGGLDIAQGGAPYAKYMVFFV